MTRGQVKLIFVLLAITTLGMIGLYYGLYLANQKYQAAQASVQGSAAGKLLGLFGLGGS